MGLNIHQIVLYNVKKMLSYVQLKDSLVKTRAVWVGALCKSTKTICEVFDLDLEQKLIKILGVVFTA